LASSDAVTFRIIVGCFSPNFKMDICVAPQVISTTGKFQANRIPWLVDWCCSKCRSYVPANQITTPDDHLSFNLTFLNKYIIKYNQRQWPVLHFCCCQLTASILSWPQSIATCHLLPLNSVTWPQMQN